MAPDSSVVDKIKKRILIDLFVTPYALFPFIGGCSLLMLAWATKVYGIFAFGGFIGCVLGIGVALTNFLFNIDKFSEKALAQIKADVMRTKNEQLNQLAKKLARTRELKDDQFLADLRRLYNEFVTDLEDQRVEVTPEIITQVDQVFEECIVALEHSFELHQTAANMPKGQKQVVWDKRSAVLKEVEESVNLLSDLMVQVRTMNTKDKKLRLSKLRGELRSQLNAAEATSDRLFEIEHGDEPDFDEYLKD
jgi:murein L,D-transpeptidase YcbB/YkuD